MSYITHKISRSPLTWIGILFAILPLLAFPEIIFGQRTLFLTDLTWFYYPCHQFAASEWLAGRIPLWDPYQYTGIPFLADTHGRVFYPLSALFLSPLSPSFELASFILIHYSLAAVFTFFLARSLSLSRVAATLAALAYGFGGFLMAQVPNLNIMSGAAWLPLLVYAAIQTTRKRSWLVAMLAGLALTLQIFTAQPQIILYSLLTVAGYALYRLCADFFPRSSSHRYDLGYALQTGLLVVVMVTTGLLAAAPQLLPTLELQQLSSRSQERGFDFLTRNSLPPIQLLNLLLPSVFGNNVTGFKGDPFQEDFVYAGFLPLLLTLFSWGQRRRRDAPFFFMLLLAAVLLSLGRYTPLYYYVIQYLPGISLFRIPSRWLMVINLALAILAGLGLETVLNKGLSRRSLVSLLVGGFMLGLTVIGIWSFKSELLLWSQALPEALSRRTAAEFLNKGFAFHPIYRDRLWLREITILTTPAVLLFTNIVVAALLFFLFSTRRFAANTFATLVVLATALDLALAGGTTINPLKPSDFWRRLSGGAHYILENLEEERLFPVGANAEETSITHLGQCYPSVYGIPSALGYGSPLNLAAYDTFLHEAHPVQAIRLTGVRYLLAQAYLGDDVAATYPIVYSDDDSLVYENKEPLPRAFIVYQAIQVQNLDEALAHFKSVDLDPRQTVVLEADVSSPIPPIQGAPPTTGAAEITDQHSQAVEIAVNTVADGYLVLLDSYYPGWVATLDGEPVGIYRANFFARAVYIPAGQHLVRFEFRPLSFRLGVGLALFTLLLIATTFLIRLKIVTDGNS